MVENLFYNGSRLINQKDINGLVPAYFIVDGNRSDGKTTWFVRMLLNRFKKGRIRKFMIVKRFKYQLPNTDEKLFKLVHERWFKSDQLSSKKREQGQYLELFFNNKACGYVVDVNSAFKLKDISQYFTDTDAIFMDEFQALEYADDEIKKFHTLITSVCRGLDQPSRYVPVYMCCNHISSLNPYYKAWGVSSQVDQMQKGFIRGDGFVIERDFNEKVAAIQADSAMNRPFKNSDIYQHSVNNTSFIDNYNFVEKLRTGKFDYICNIIVDKQYISLRRVYDIPGVNYYFSDQVNKSHNTNFVIKSNDHDQDTFLLKRNIQFLMAMKNQFDHGFVRFSSLEVKEKAFEFLMIMV